MKLIVGLGNSGSEYEKTRHNVGFQAVDMIKKKYNFPEFALQKKFFALTSEGEINGEKIMLVKPETFMNSSGKAVQALYAFYHCAPADVWVIYDDVDLPLGILRIRPEGSAGTHNGMKSIIGLLGFQNFPRIRIGIESRGELAPRQQDTTSFVLHPFSEKERTILKKVLEKVSAALSVAMEKGIVAAMDTFN